MTAEAVPDRLAGESYLTYAARLSEWRPAPLQPRPGESAQSFIDRQARYSPPGGHKLRRRTETPEQHAARLERMELADREARAAAEQEAVRQQRRAERSAVITANQRAFAADLVAALVRHLRDETDRPGSALAGCVDVVLAPSDAPPRESMAGYPTCVIVQGGTWLPAGSGGGHGDRAQVEVLTRGTDSAALRRLWSSSGPLVEALRNATTFSYDAGRSRQTDGRNCARITEDLTGPPNAAGGRPLVVAAGYFETTHTITLEGRGRAEVPPPLTPPREAPVETWVDSDGRRIDPAKTVFGAPPR